MAKRAMVYLQSGGPTAVINTSLLGAVTEARKHPEEIEGIYGALHGIEGLINDELIDLGAEDEAELELLRQTPGAVLGTTRYMLPKDFHDAQYARILATLQKHNIGYVFINGGNDSMDTSRKLELFLGEMNYDCRVVGVPKTVDNDLAETDHSLGFGSAAKYVVNAVSDICLDASCYHRGKVFVIEIMGRNAGWLTAAVDLLPEDVHPDYIYLPENAFDLEGFLRNVRDVYNAKGHCVVAISEGIVFDRDVSAARVDAFNHIQLGGAAAALARIVEKRLNLPTRSIELSLSQRACSRMLSKVDADEAFACGAFAVQKAVEGASGVMIGIKRISDDPYQVEYDAVPLEKVANVERRLPPEMMAGLRRMSDAFRAYCAPLIQGEVPVLFENGIVRHARLKKVRLD